MNKNSQQEFWKGVFGRQYRENNTNFNSQLEEECWSKMLSYFGNNQPKSYLECGSNIGRNLITLNHIIESPELSLIELNKASYEIAVNQVKLLHAFNGAIH